MIELETNSGIDNDKHNKLHKYRLYKVLKGLLEFNDESDYLDLSNQGSV